MSKIVLIVFYFGSFPNYFSFFLDSCKRNPDIDWRIYTDNKKAENWPSNVTYIQMSWQECQKLFQSRFPFKIQLHEPRKICDYKPAYGYVLEDSISGYDYWGHCDLDQIFGDLRCFLTEELLTSYDKLFALGHFTLYRNSFEVNRCFMQEINGKKRYQEVFQSSLLQAFDEWGEENINAIFEQSDYSFLSEEFGADVWPEHTDFNLCGYNKESGRYEEKENSRCFFRIQNDKLLCYQKENQIIEYPYVHLQKRKMKVEKGVDFLLNYDIVPGEFCTCGNSSFKFLEASRTKFLDEQYLKVKWGNMKARIRMRIYK